MVYTKKMQAIELRKKGWSQREISQELKSAQGNISVWTRGVVLTESQKANLKARTYAPESLEQKGRSRKRNENAKRLAVIGSSKKFLMAMGKRELQIIGTTLYWSHGARRPGNVQFSSSDPQKITLIMLFFREACKVSESKFRIYIHLNGHQNSSEAERYWQNITGVQPKQFYKTYNKPGKVRESNGVCTIYVLDSHLQLQIQGWINGIYETALKMV